MLLLLACATSEDSDAQKPGEEAGVVDLRMEFQSPPEGGTQFVTPTLEVPPYTEIIYCYYGKWEGEDVGVNYMTPLSVGGYTHHNQLKAVDDNDTRFAPGTLTVCPDPHSNMPVYAPLFESVGFPTTGGDAPEVDANVAMNWINFPEGVAFKLRHNQQWVMDVHYVNTTGDTLLVNAAVNLGMLPITEVKQWAASLQFDSGDLNILPQQDTTVTFTCDWDGDYTVLSVMGHMHDHGTLYKVDYNKEDGSTETIYEVNPFTPSYREWPKINAYAAGQLAVKKGESFTTTCGWHNDTDEVLAYPEEMCTTVGVVYPMESPHSCFGGHPAQ